MVRQGDAVSSGPIAANDVEFKSHAARDYVLARLLQRLPIFKSQIIQPQQPPLSSNPLVFKL